MPHLSCQKDGLLPLDPQDRIQAPEGAGIGPDYFPGWEGAVQELDSRGWCRLPALLRPGSCEGLRALYESEQSFRSRVIMQRHGFGRGEYRYFDYPLPEPVAALRSALYARLAAVANSWHERLGFSSRFPAELDAFLAACRQGGQTKPTPLVLRYGPGDYNCLHQDLYGEQAFPLQVAVLLSQPEREFEGGEFVLTEQRPRMQSRAAVVRLEQGDAVIFAVNSRPARGARGDYRVRMRHGVSEVRSGSRYALGIIFHDAA